jgi:predicted ATPase
MLTRIQIRNYKSIAACSLELGSLQFFVGPNGSGKSNFLDAIRFVADSLRTSLSHALRERGGINEVRRRSGGHPNHFGMRLEFVLDGGARGHYSFRVGARPQGGYEVQNEECEIFQSAEDVGEAEGDDDANSSSRRLSAPIIGRAESFFGVRSGDVTSSSIRIPPAGSADRLYLVNASGLPAFRPLFDALSHMGFYNLSPWNLRELQPADAGDLLSRDGSNITSVMTRLARSNPAAKTRIEEYLSKVVPGVTGVDVKAIGPREILEFRQFVPGAKFPWRFMAGSMSDGTVRALGVLVALFQAGNGARVPLVGIEEPEMALHPGAVGVLMDALVEASQTTQVLVTSHSPDLLDDPRVDASQLVAVLAEGGVTRIAPPDTPGRKALRDKLYTAGDLLRLNQLMPESDMGEDDEPTLFDLPDNPRPPKR